MHDPVNTPALPDEQHPAWLLGPADTAAIRADDRRLMARFVRSELLDENDRDHVTAVLARWHEVTTSTTTNATTRGIGGYAARAVPNPGQPHWGDPNDAGRLALGWAERLELASGAMFRAVEIIVPEVPALRRVCELLVRTR